MKNETLTTPITNTIPNQPGSAIASRRTKVLVVGAALLGAGVVRAAGIAPRLRAHERLVAQSQENTRPVVVVTNVTRAADSVELVLPASVRAYEETSLYSRANGYLKRWLVDIGNKVEEGQVL